MKYVITQKDKGRFGDITKKLQEVLAACRATEGEKIITFEKGEYHFFRDSAEERIVYASNTNTYKSPRLASAINIEGIKNLTIDGEGSDFIMHGRMIALRIFESENIKLQNFSWDFPCAGNFEMHVREVGKNYVDYYIPKTLQWKPEMGNIRWFETSPFTGEEYWHSVGSKNSHCVVGFNSLTGNVSRYPINKGPFAGRYKIKKTGEHTVRISYIKPVDKSLYFVGMSFEMNPNFSRLCTGAFLNESKNLSLENISVHYLHGFAFLTQMCENISFNKCRFTPKEGGDRISTSYADHLHFSGAKGKITIDSCVFSNAHDDPINIHGTFTRVKKALGKRTLLLEYVHPQQSGFKQYHIGDRVIFYDRETFEGCLNEKEFVVTAVSDPLTEGLGLKEMKVTFSEDLPEEITVPKKFAAENVTYTPEVYIGNCLFKSIPTRGILCTTRKKVLIENNTFDGMTMASIYLSNDCNDWYESGAIHDMTIKGNRFYIKKSPHSGPKPAVFIDPIVAKGDKVSSAVHKNITIENNDIYLEHETAVLAKYTENLNIKNNRIIFSDSYSGDKNSVFQTDDCLSVTAEDNEIE